MIHTRINLTSVEDQQHEKGLWSDTMILVDIQCQRHVQDRENVSVSYSKLGVLQGPVVKKDPFRNGPQNSPFWENRPFSLTWNGPFSRKRTIDQNRLFFTTGPCLYRIIFPTIPAKIYLGSSISHHFLKCLSNQLASTRCSLWSGCRCRGARPRPRRRGMAQSPAAAAASEWSTSWWRVLIRT